MKQWLNNLNSRMAERALAPEWYDNFWLIPLYLMMGASYWLANKVVRLAIWWREKQNAISRNG